MIDHFFSFFNNYRSKVRNPFIGTMIGVWMIRNWKVIYAFFTFDEDYTMQGKINYFESYFEKISFWRELLSVIGITFLSLLLTFILLALSRAITDFYYKIVEPFIITVIDRQAIFTRAEKVKLENKLEGLTQKLDKQSDLAVKAENLTEVMRNRHTESIKNLEDELKLASDKIEEITAKVLNNQKEINSFSPFINSFTDFYNSIPRSVIATFLVLYRSLQRGEIKRFEKGKDENIRQILQLGFIEIDFVSGYIKNISPLGEFFYDVITSPNKPRRTKLE
ncbi:hypothetical protein [uncultured Flavobacterium sp.]|uniref:hypothetical protein n=1 Tax=uncultured Flavobacterium sp. TaxID=165435 RepID=UPI002595381C|nr:hypothetical protein [uncultured Flavobacterium sp.]